MAPLYALRISLPRTNRDFSPTLIHEQSKADVWPNLSRSFFFFLQFVRNLDFYRIKIPIALKLFIYSARNVYRPISFRIIISRLFARYLFRKCNNSRYLYRGSGKEIRHLSTCRIFCNPYDVFFE
jgi:hypothetical protein